tara:strand:- start:358 stop:813 length:456 start_codon:yes stop_codon:yes gene_type:complete
MEQQISSLANWSSEGLQPEGTLTLSPSVVATIASKEATQVEGIVGLEDTFIRDIVAMVHGGSHPKGVTVDVGDGEVSITLRLSVRYGVSIPNIILELRNRVSESVKTMTSYDVRSVNVTVNRIFLKDEDADETLKLLASEAGLEEEEIEFQ